MAFGILIVRVTNSPLQGSWQQHHYSDHVELRLLITDVGSPRNNLVCFDAPARELLNLRRTAFVHKMIVLNLDGSMYNEYCSVGQLLYILALK